MDTGDNAILLSDILKSSYRFSFFQELINLKQLEQTTSEYLLSYDLLKIESTILDIIKYFESLIEIFHDIDEATIDDKNSIDWIYEGRVEIMEIHRNLESIDDIISQLLVLIENKLVEFKSDDDDENENNNNKKLMKMLDNFEIISELSLRVKKYSIFYKKRMDISIQFKELDSQVIDSIDQEIENCLKKAFRIHEIRMSSPSRKIENLDLENLIKKLQLIKKKTFFKIPTFNEIDESLSNQFLELQEKVSPINASITFIPEALANFSIASKDIYPDSDEILLEKYNSLKEKLLFLNQDLKDLKMELIDQKWNEIFNYLIKEVIFLIKDIKEGLAIEEDQKVSTNDNDSNFKMENSKIWNFKIKTVQKTIDTLKEAILKEKLTQDSIIIEKFDKVSKKWNKLITNINIKDLEQADDNTEFDYITKLNILNSVKKDNADLYEIMPNFFNKANKQQQQQQQKVNNNVTPSKIQRNKNLRTTGTAFIGALNFQPVYIENTPVSSSTNETGSIDAVIQFKDKSLTQSLIDQSFDDSTIIHHQADITDLVSAIENINLDNEAESIPVQELSSPVSIRATSNCLQNNNNLVAISERSRNKKSMIPIAFPKLIREKSLPFKKMEKNSAMSIKNESFEGVFKEPKRISSLPTSQEIHKRPSLIPKPTSSRSSSRLGSSRCSLRSSNSSSSPLSISGAQTPRASTSLSNRSSTNQDFNLNNKKRTSRSSSTLSSRSHNSMRQNLNNITNVTNNSSNSRPSSTTKYSDTTLAISSSALNNNVASIKYKTNKTGSRASYLPQPTPVREIVKRSQSSLAKLGNYETKNSNYFFNNDDEFF
ncbi:hypothetical protein PACTADRAFT_50439 [Pachysolen tannophilus NRRL Y-2460]|uniref:Karyogamy protein n=1 Tax=Pachysolen tannophilus NRRL Y-2460 TaxID=669874 RepID=A0A1E4TS20_PACTA|nr:hypothetical protein PACTADRAFT_50439 [Pachysolen tannophilus NRRL Y-2460]